MAEPRDVDAALQMVAAIVEQCADIQDPATAAELIRGLSDEVFADLGVPGRVLQMRRTLTNESDRGCALVAAAHLDEELVSLLRAFMVDSPGSRRKIDILLSPSGPIGSLSVRIDLCQALGLLREATCRDLHLVRRIRNEFAHLSEALTFETPQIAQRCAEFSMPHWEDAARRRFISSVMKLSATIEVAKQAHPRRRAAPPLSSDAAQSEQEFQRRAALLSDRLSEMLRERAKSQP